MRQIFTVRFFAAVGALLGLVLVLTTVFRGDDSVAELVERAPMERRIDLVALVFSTTSENFAIGPDGFTTGTLNLVLDQERTVRVVPGTVGEITCPALQETAKCAVLADLLGDAVVWFAVVPLASSQTIALPAIVSLDDGYATLVNGWQLPHAPVLERQCPRDFESFNDFRAELGTNFTSIYRFADGKITHVACTP